MSRQYKTIIISSKHFKIIHIKEEQNNNRAQLGVSEIVCPLQHTMISFLTHLLLKNDRRYLLSGTPNRTPRGLFFYRKASPKW